MQIPVLPIFVSSTWKDLEPEREAVEAAIQRLRETKFVGMEYFGSRDETTRRASLDEVDRSAVYLGILAARYGSGITQDEYRRARERDLPCFIYFKADATIPDELRETDPARLAKLEAFKSELRANHIVGPDFTNPDDLAAKVATDLHRWLFDHYLTPTLERAARGELPHARAQELLSGVRDTSPLSPALLAQLMARHQLRAAVGDFVGREKEIASLTVTLRGGTSAAISGISGMGGIGKTELALKVANELRDAYPDAQLVVDMRGTDTPPRDPSDALASCIRAFVGLEKKLPDDPEQLTHLYRSALQGKRALILLDNAHDSAQVRPLLPPQGSALLVTSRNAVTLPRMTRVMLEQLSETEARELLTGIAPRIPASLADQISYLCGYLPLALRAAGSLLDVTIDLDPKTYAEQLRDERRRLELLGTEGVDISVEASFNLSYARLPPDAARVFRLLSVFPATFDAAAEETICEDPAHKHLSDLLRRNLVIYDTDTHRYRLHDLARLFADSRLSEDERNLGQQHQAAHYLEVLRECSKSYLKGGELVRNSLALFDKEQRNIEAGQKWASQRADPNEAVARLCNGYGVVAPQVLELRQHPSVNIAWFEAALESARRLKDRDSEGRHLGHMGLAYAALGDARRAIELYEQALAIAREIGNRLGEGRALGNMGLAYSNLGDMQRAIELFEQRLTIARGLGDRRGEGTVLGNMGVTYNRMGEVARAIEFLEQHLSIAREVGDRLGESKALGNLGIAYEKLGEIDRAIELYEQQLAIAREIGYRTGQGNALFNTALMLDKLGSRSKAIANAEVALEIYRQLESPWAKKVLEKLAEWRGEV
ncbi:MAG TPA: tetratricopeptide repeat protein [Pyrinomonadaceae bacterium]|jgi:tetratricopeptide (TPR) repeat protein|nr:tetratricopeptide repeat protein [Pyrinomonadaceae bacterium]